jgi:acyl dehydratase
MTMTAQGTDAWRFALIDLVRYSGASLDFNTIHYDATASRAAGFDGVIAHGMLTLGRVLARVADETGPGELVACRARFRAPVYLDAPVAATMIERSGTGLEITVTCGETVALTAEVQLGGKPASEIFAVPEGELVADHRLRVERGALTQLARAVGARAAVWYDERVAKEVGLPGVPGVPTLAFALPVLGWYLDDQTDPAPRRPDPVADSARWAQSSGPVVHAGQTFTYRRPLTAGERVRSRRWITGRNTKVGSTGELRFTEVTQLVTDERDEPVVAAAMTLLATGPAPAAT